jgi:hypothetical protein
LEKASLEDLQDDTLIEMWANLIVTASTEDVQMLGQYINILANIVPKQVQLLENMFDNAHDAPLQAGHLIDNYYYLNQTGVPATFDEYSSIDNTEEFASVLVSCLNIKGVIIDTINVFLLGEASGGFWAPRKIATSTNLCESE